MNQGIYTIQEIATITDGFGHFSTPQTMIRTLATDSRKLEDLENALFFALPGRRDGHAYIPDVYEQGGRNFMVSRYDRDLDKYPGANFIAVADTLKALQQLAAYHRRQFDIPVIAITGSNGKTIVKEWLYQLLAPDQQVIRSPKSYNSQIGVPLSVWNMNKNHTLAIFEAGISKEGEMSALENVIRPTIGVLTTIGEAHNEGFESRGQKIAEKLSLFKNCELLICSPGHLAGYTGDIPGKRVFTWSTQPGSDLTVVDDEELEERYRFLRGNFNGMEVQCVVPFTDSASVENALSCWATLLALGYDPAVVDERMEKLQPVKMRLELKNGINRCSVIDDSYSLDVSSLAIALDFLRQQNQHVKRTLVLSDIPESGVPPGELYAQVAALLESKQVDRLVAVGEAIGAHRELFHMPAEFFNSVDELIADADLWFSDEAILLKGARAFRFERISRMLTQKVHETVLEISLDALEHNLNYYKSLLGAGVKMMAIVKAFSYGSGSVEIANLLQFNKVDYLAVAFADEGVALREAGIRLPIMVMNPDEGAFDLLVEHRLEPELYSQQVLEAFTNVLNRRAISDYPVHLKLDTGMHRLGFMPGDMDRLLEALSGTTQLDIRSVFSHLVSSEDPADDEFTRRQLDEFTAMADRIAAVISRPFLRHVANTSGISRHRDAQFDMVRLGIGLYGLDSAYPGKNPLQPAATLRTSISQIKELVAGDTVGYNRKGKVGRDSRIATVKIGYADGYDRRLGNGVGSMLVNGKMAPTIGNICMDMCMLDITGIDAMPGDEVIVFNDKLTVTTIAQQLGTIPYEVLTGISQRVKRVYFYE